MINVDSHEFSKLIPGLLAQQGSVEFTPHGVSMLPTISENDTVTLKACSDVKKFDILLYKRKNGKVVLHRVVGRDNDGGFVMRGDAQWNIERGITPDDVLAVVSAINKKGRPRKTDGIPFYLHAFRINSKNRIVRFSHRAVCALRRIKK